MTAQGLAGGRGLQVRQAPLEDVFLAVTLQAELEHAQVGQHALAPLLPRRSCFLPRRLAHPRSLLLTSKAQRCPWRGPEPSC